MYWFNVKALAEDLKNETLSEKEKVKYFFVYFLFVTLALALSNLETEDKIPDVLRYTSLILEPIIAIVGLILCYIENKSRDNKDFIVRFISLSWPISIRLLLVFIPWFIVLSIVYAIMTSDLDPTLSIQPPDSLLATGVMKAGESEFYYNAIMTGLSTAFSLAYFYLMLKYIAVSAGKGSKEK
ncbi:MAG: hypothetical protein OEZ36_05845 [Spirochaetota bacterium]|nr:hypothetical protein [Spirochaetota bacterium]